MFSTRKLPQQQRSRKLVEAINQAAAHILEDGSMPFTTNHIAKKAGISIGSLYQYFSSADAIMANLIEIHVKEERGAAINILQAGFTSNADVLRELTIAFVTAHSKAPRLTGQLHAMAPSFGLQEHLNQSRDEQARQIAAVLGLCEQAVQISAMAVEGVVLAMLANDPEQLTNERFIKQLHAIALAPLAL